MTTISTLNLRHGGGTRTQKIITCLESLNSDILVLTEFRNNDSGQNIKSALIKLGLINHYTTNADPKSNTVLIATKQPFTSQTFPELNNHSQRVIKISSNNITLFGTYFPGKEEKKHLFEFLIKYVQNNPDEKVIITGDINTGKHYLDEKGATFFHAEYFDKIEQLGYIDAWRLINGNVKEYTWYSNAGNGFRLDHFFVHQTLKENVKRCFYNHQIRIDKTSDHSLMTLELS